MTFAEHRQRFYQKLSGIYLQGELQAVYHWCVKEIEGWDRAEAYLHNEDEMKQDDRWNEVLGRLIKNEPVQYIFNKAPFFGMELFVDERVLIPRPETEELVQRIIDRPRPESTLKVLDIGTGSGCIALALEKARPAWQIQACDVSVEALEVAQTNAETHHSNVRFFHCDIGDEASPIEAIDIIVSNPPYIPTSLKSELDANVRDHEPAIALFAPDREPLYFFRRILERAASLNVPEVWFETHATDLGELKLLAVKNGYSAEVIIDFSAKPRFMKCDLQT